MEVIFLYNIENLRDQDSESINQINCLEEHVGNYFDKKLPSSMIMVIMVMKEKT